MATAQGQADNPLARLDRNVPTAFIWQLTMLATIGGFLFGYDTANIGSALQFIPYQMTGLELGYLVAGTSIGAAVGALAAGFLTDRFGRKSMLIVDAGIFAAGAILSAVTWHAWVLLVARTLIGLAIGADSAIATAYISEYAPKDRRGSLALLQQWMITIGILVSYLIGLLIFLSLPGLAYSLDWRLIFAIGAIPALIGLVLRTQMPESPRWLLVKGRYDKARDALAHLGVQATEADVQRTADQVRAAERQQQAQRAARWTPGAKRALLVVCVFFIFQQITGINIPFYYGPLVLAPLFPGGGSAVVSAVHSIEATAIIAVFNVGATYFAFRFIDRVGRRKLAMGGYAGMALFMLIGALLYTTTAGTARGILVTAALTLFVISFAIGVGGTGWLIQGEVFPTAIRGQAAAIGATADWVANFAIILIFPVLQASLGLPLVMVLFALLSILAILFVNAFLPETKELSVDEVVEVFERAAQRPPRPQIASP